MTETGSTYLTTLADRAEDVARTENWPEGRLARVLDAAALPEIAGKKYYPTERMWDGVADSIIGLALTAVKHDEAIAAAPPADTPAKKALRLAGKAAFGETPTLSARAALRRVLIDQGASPKDADAQLAEIAKGFGASLSNLAPGKLTPREFMGPKAAARAALEDDDEPERSEGVPERTEKKSPPIPRENNPWSAVPGAWNLSEQGRLCRVFGLEAAQKMAASVGCKIGDTRPNPNFKK